MTISADTDHTAASDLQAVENSSFEPSLELASVHRSLLAWVKAEMNWVRRLWWHTKAYGTILGVVVLASGSLVALFVYQRLRQLFR